MSSNLKCILVSIEMKLKAQKILNADDIASLKDIIESSVKVRELYQQYPQLHSELRANFPDTDFHSSHTNLEGSGDSLPNSKFVETASHSCNMLTIDKLSSNFCGLNLEDSLVCEHCDEEIILLNNDLEFSYQMHEQTSEHVEAMNDFKVFHSPSTNEADAITSATVQRGVSLYHWTSPYKGEIITTKLPSGHDPFTMIKGKNGATLYKTNFVFNNTVMNKRSRTQKWKERVFENKHFQNTSAKKEQESCKGVNRPMTWEKNNEPNDAVKDSFGFKKRRDRVLEDKHFQDTLGEVEGSSKRVNGITAREKKFLFPVVSSKAAKSRVRTQRWREYVLENEHSRDSLMKLEEESSKGVNRTTAWVEKVVSSNAVKARFGTQNSKGRVLEKKHFQDRSTSSAEAKVEEESSPWDNIGKKMYLGFRNHQSFTDQNRLRKKLTSTKPDLLHY